MSRQRFVLEEMAPGELVPNPANFRRHPHLQKIALQASVDEYGWVDAPLWNKRTRNLIDGHARVELALANGEALIPVKVVEMPLAQERRLLRSFDAIGAMALVDDEALASLIESIDDAALEQLLGEVSEPASGLLPEADPDALPERVETRCKAGELWALGGHRLLCGDATKREDVERLMGGALADLLFTSPPYLEQRTYERGVGDWNELMEGTFASAPVIDGQILVNLGLVHRDGEWLPYWDDWIAWMRLQGWRRFGFYVWDQGAGLPGDWNGRLAPSHEFVFHFNRLAERARKSVKSKLGNKRRGAATGLRQADGHVTSWSHGNALVQPFKIPDSVFRVTRHMARGIEVTHPAIFPVDLPRQVVEAFSDPADSVYDPFAGSGTTILACEQTGRVARCLEIEPRYCDVCLARWEQATGREAVRL